MTHEEALKWTEDSIAEGRILPEQESFNYVLKVKEALEKRMPKKPNDKFNVPYAIIAYGICPSCGLDVNSDMKFCSECGQAIDWR